MSAALHPPEQPPEPSPEHLPEQDPIETPQDTPLHVDRLEGIWIWLSLLMTVAFAIAIIYSGTSMGIHLTFAEDKAMLAAATATTATTPTPTVDVAQAVQSASLGGDAARGKQNFAVCAACHAPDGSGVKGLGKALTTSEFVAGKSDAELLDFLKVGRAVGDPLNTTGVTMPPKGGNPAFSQIDLIDIVAYLRTLQQ